ncbi:MAG: putative uridylyltransferase [Deltaproteobacteria bacterium ADurb.Bin510]|nr:MAG: putative uridylyltransferase [Deltaproteobacteria bacterium ADurb.Bin510]
MPVPNSNAQEKTRLEADLAQVDQDLVKRLMAGEGLYVAPEGAIEPVEAYTADYATSAPAAADRALGAELLAAGQVAVVLVAGGQGSRLGVEGPKGAVPVSPVQHKSLFQIHAEKVLALSLRYGVKVPLYIMTSVENDAATRAFFAEHNYFGLAAAEVIFFTQGRLPSLRLDGGFIMGRDGGLFMNPDGHGGTFAALEKSGCLDDMRSRGIEEIFYFQVDNPLVQVADPLFVGLHHRSKAQMSSKVVRKRDCDEKVGVIASLNGRTVVVEYSDLPTELRYACDEAGKMRYWAGSLAIHLLRRDFVEQLTSGGLKLPYHRAVKKIPTLDEAGKPVEVEGVKFETFLFDALPLAERSVTLEVERAAEFAPVKNATGEDSLATSQQMQSDLHRSWLEAAGVKVAVGVKVEISPLRALSAADLDPASLPETIDRDCYLD